LISLGNSGRYEVIIHYVENLKLDTLQGTLFREVPPVATADTGRGAGSWPCQGINYRDHWIVKARRRAAPLSAGSAETAR